MDSESQIQTSSSIVRPPLIDKTRHHPPLCNDASRKHMLPSGGPRTPSGGAPFSLVSHLTAHATSYRTPKPGSVSATSTEFTISPMPKKPHNTGLVVTLKHSPPTLKIGGGPTAKLASKKPAEANRGVLESTVAAMCQTTVDTTNNIEPDHMDSSDVVQLAVLPTTNVETEVDPSNVEDSATSSKPRPTESTSSTNLIGFLNAAAPRHENVTKILPDNAQTNRSGFSVDHTAASVAGAQVDSHPLAECQGLPGTADDQGTDVDEQSLHVIQDIATNDAPAHPGLPASKHNTPAVGSDSAATNAAAVAGVLDQLLHQVVAVADEASTLPAKMGQTKATMQVPAEPPALPTHTATVSSRFPASPVPTTASSASSLVTAVSATMSPALRNQILSSKPLNASEQSAVASTPTKLTSAPMCDQTPSPVTSSSLLSLAATVTPPSKSTTQIAPAPTESANCGAQSTDSNKAVLAANTASSPAVGDHECAANIDDVLRKRAKIDPPPVVTVVHWGACDVCKKWRIVATELDENAAFVCSDVPGKTCNDPEDEMPVNSVPDLSPSSSAEYTAAWFDNLKLPTNSEQAVSSKSTPCEARAQKRPEADLLSCIMSQSSNGSGASGVTMFEDLFLHKLDKMLQWKDREVEFNFKSKTLNVDDGFPQKFLDPFSAQLVSLRRIETEQSLKAAHRETVGRFLGHLDNQIARGSQLCALDDFYVKKAEKPLKSAMVSAVSAMSAATVSLELMSVRFEEVHFLFLEDDRLLSAIKLCKHNLFKHAYPVFDESFRHHLQSKSADTETATTAANRKRKASAFTLGTGTVKKSVRELGRNMCAMTCRILDILKHLASKIKFPDSAVMRLVSLCLTTFSVDSSEVSALQLSALEVIRSIFSSYRDSRLLIANDVIHFIARNQLPKRVPRRFGTIKPRIEIQTTTALLLQLVQSCCQTRDAHVPYKSLMKEPQRIAIQFCKVILRQCIQTQDREKAKAAQKTVDHFIVDLLNVYNRPDWPGAAVVVQHFAQTLQKQIERLNAKASARGKSGSHVVPAINFLLRTFGDIYRRVKVDMVERDSISLDLSISKNFKLDGRPGDEDEDNTCICGKECLAPPGDRPEDMLDCDTCHKWYHLKCFGIANATALKTWNCDTCLVRSATATIIRRLRVRQQTAASKAKAAAAQERQQQSDKQKEKNASATLALSAQNAVRKSSRPRKKSKKLMQLDNLDSDDDSDADGETSQSEARPDTDQNTETDLKRQLLLNFVTDLGRSQPAYAHLRTFYLDKWACLDAHQRPVSDKNHEVQSLFSDPDLQRDIPSQAPGTIDAAVLSPLKSFILSRDLGLDELACGISFDAMAGVLFDAFLDASSQTIRAAATKAIASVAHIDPDMLSRRQFKWLIKTTLNDPSIGVRHNIVEALGNCIATTTSLAATDEYVSFLLKKLGDTGFSVRKAVVKILHLLLMRRRNHPQRSQIIKQLVQRYQFLEEEESLKAIILECISQLWFHNRARGSSNVASLSNTQSEFVEPILAKIDEFHTTSIARLHADIARLPDGWSQERGTYTKWNTPMIYRSPKGRVCRSMIQAVHIARLELSEESNNGDEEPSNSKRSCIDEQHLENPEKEAAHDDTGSATKDFQHFDVVAAEIVDVASTISPEWLSLIVQKLVDMEVSVIMKTCGDVKVNRTELVDRTKIIETCRKLVKRLVDLAHTCEIEVRHQSGAASALNELQRRADVSRKKLMRAKQAYGKQMENLRKLRTTFAVLACMCTVSERLLLPFINDFTVYLDDDDILGNSHDETAIVFHFVKIIGLCAARLADAKEASGKVSTDILKKLQRKIFTCPTRELVVASIDTLCRICEAHRNAKPIFSIMGKFFRFLHSKRKSGSNRNVVLDVRRSLTALGYFCMFGKLGKRAQSQARSQALSRSSTVLAAVFPTAQKKTESVLRKEAVEKGLSLDNVLPAIYDQVVFYALEFGSQDPGVQQDATEALIAFFSAAPAFLIRPQSSTVIANGLRSKYPAIRASTLRFLSSMLDREEKRVTNREKDEAETHAVDESVKDKIIASGSEHNFITDGLRNHTETVQHLLLDKNSLVQLAAIQLQSLLLRQGLVDPSRSVAILIAMQCDEHVEVATRSLHLLRTIGSGVGAMKAGNINAYCLQGIALAFKRQLSSTQQSTTAAVATFKKAQQSKSTRAVRRSRGDDDSVDRCYSFLGPVFSDVINQNDRHRHEFFEICVNAFKHTENLVFVSKSKKSNSKRNAKADVVSSPNFQSTLKPSYLRFLASSLALLPFELEDQVVALVLIINQALSVHATPIKDDINRLLMQTELAFNTPAENSKDQSGEQCLPGSEKWRRSDTKKIVAAICYLQLLRLKTFLVRRYKLEEGKFVGASSKIGKSSIRRKAVVSSTSLKQLRFTSAKTLTVLESWTSSHSDGCPLVIIRELKQFVREITDDVVIFSSSSSCSSVAAKTSPTEEGDASPSKPSAVPKSPL